MQNTDFRINALITEKDGYQSILVHIPGELV
jgi:hypothetical protein